MKERSIEEKAQRNDGNYKAYIELINRLENVKDAIKKQNYGIAMDILCKPYPEFQITTSTELAESEDERIRKELIAMVRLSCTNGDDVDKKIAWLEKQGESDETKAKIFLINKGYPIDSNGKFPTYEEMYYIIKDGLEKQGEQKPTDKIELKFKVGDFIVNDYCMGRIIEITNDAYLLDTEQSIPFSCEHNVHLWTIQDAKDGDILSDGYSIVIFRGIGNEKWNDVIDYHIGLFTNSKRLVVQKSLSHWGRINEVTLYPATKEQHDILFKKIHEAGYEWDAEKKELKKIEQKSSWSEEDERMYRGLHNLIYSTPYCDSRKELSDWLESLKDRYTWKPSEYELKVLKLAAEKDGACLMGLYEDLKKLREE